MEEEWKDIANFEGLYQVSNLGRVKSLSKVGSGGHNGIILSQSKDKDGYLLVYLYANRKKVACKVHKVCMDISGDINNDKERSARISSIKD